MFDTVDSLISKFTTLADKLEKRAEAHAAASLTHTMLAQKAEDQAKFHAKEVERANNIASKIRKLVS